MPEVTELHFKDFSLTGAEAEPKRFKIGNDVFVAPPVIPNEMLGELAGLSADLEAMPAANLKEKLAAMLELVAQAFEKILTPETGPVFRERLFSKTDPIDLRRQAMPALLWLIEVYGMRPTEPSSSSANGDGDGGGGLTGSALNGV